MSKLKPSWVKTDIPKGIKVKFWEVMMDNPTHVSFLGYLNKHSTEFPDEIKRYFPLSPQTYKKLKDEILQMPLKEVDTLSIKLQSWILELRPDLKAGNKYTNKAVEKPIQEIPQRDVRNEQVKKHFNDLAEVVKTIYDAQQRLLSYEKDELGNVTEDDWGMFHFPPPKNQSKLSQIPGNLEAPDHEVASYFFEHFCDEFPKIGLTNWKELLRKKLPLQAIKKLKYWKNTADFQNCTTCEVCMDLRSCS